MKILVTGGGGFLGRYIVKDLVLAGHDVSILGRRSQPDLMAQGIMCHQGDVANADAVLLATRGCDAVIHVAAKAGVWGSKQSYFDANVNLGYRFNEKLSVFVKGNNLAGQNYERWANFPVQGIQVLGGITYKFNY